MTHVLETARSATVIMFVAAQARVGFTSRDLLELQRWDGEGRRLEIDPCSAEGQFAMVFGGPESWASWAISRDNGKLLVWDCVSHADIGRFDTMREALAAVPGARDAPALPVPVPCSAEVIPLRRVALAG